MTLFAEVVDWEKVILALATLITGALATYATMYSRVKKARTSSNIEETKQQLDSRSEAFREMQRLLTLTRRDLEATREEMRQQEEWFNQRVDQLRKEVADCHGDKNELTRRMAGQDEQIRWLKRILKEHGWISDDGESPDPTRTKSDWLKKPPLPPEGDNK